MMIPAWIAVGAFVAAVIARMAEPHKAIVRWDVASTWFSLAKEIAMWAVVIRVLS